METCNTFFNNSVQSKHVSAIFVFTNSFTGTSNFGNNAEQSRYFDEGAIFASTNTLSFTGASDFHFRVIFHW